MVNTESMRDYLGEHLLEQLLDFDSWPERLKNLIDQDALIEQGSEDENTFQIIQRLLKTKYKDFSMPVGDFVKNECFDDDKMGLLDAIHPRRGDFTDFWICKGFYSGELTKE